MISAQCVVGDDMNPKTSALVIVSLLALSPAVLGRRPHKLTKVTAVRMNTDGEHKMIRIGCQINGGRRYLCVIDSGATFTIISDRVLKPEGPLMDVTTANGVLHVHQQEVSLTIAEGLELRSKAFVQSTMTLPDIDVLVGQDVLRQFRSVLFDYENNQVEFER